MTQAKSNDLALLIDLIQSNGTKMLDVCSKAGQNYPSVYDAFDPKAEEIRRHPEIHNPANVVLAAARQLVAMLEEPNVSIRQVSFGPPLYFTLKTVVDAHVPEILDAAGPKGLHVNEIGSKAGMDPKKLGRLLRLLATSFLFKEVSPEVFAHNRTSAILSTGKPLEEILRDVSKKFDGTNGVAAHTSMQTVWTMKAGAQMPTTLLTDPKLKFSESPDDCSFNQVFDGHSLWEYLAMEENKAHRKRFDIAMATHAKFNPPDALAKAYDWGSLPEGSYFIDVGGGMGGVTMGLLKNHPRLKGIVQDLQGAVTNGKKWFSETFPEALKSGQVTFEVHNFFDPQPPRDHPPAIFILRLISHDFSDSYLVMILTNLRRSAGPETKLLIQDLILLHACPETEENTDPGLGVGSAKSEVKISGEPIPPEPLLRNWAKAAPYLADIMMLNNLNGQERTLLNFQRVFSSSGWELVEVTRGEEIGLHMPLLIAVPAGEPGAVQ